MAIRETQTIRGSRVEFSNGTALRFRSDVDTVAKQWLPSAGRAVLERTPAEQELPHELQLALNAHEALEQETVQLETLPEPPADDVVELSPAGDVPSGFARVVLYRDESGGFSWHFPLSLTPLEMRALRAGGDGVFRIPMRTAAARVAVAEHRATLLAERSLVSLIGRKVFKVLLLPIAARVLGNPVRELVEWWEKRAHTEMLRVLTASALTAPPQPFTDWERLATGRALLVIHGIFSSTDGMLSRLAPAQMQQLEDLYERRVIAFDHFTVSRTPEENARLLLAQLAEHRPEGRRFDFDILCHSRGGIVARTLCERAAELDPAGAASFHKIFFAATPNRGSALANPDRLVDFLDVFTNLATMVPSGPVAVTLEIVLAVLKLAAYTATTEVPGIAAMSPRAGGYIEKTLNGSNLSAPEDYASVAANYEPDPARDSAFFTAADAVIDRVFGHDVGNDLVVPTDGVFTGLGRQRASIAKHVYTNHVWHTELFAQSKTVELALEHYRRPDAPAADAFDGRLRRSIPVMQLRFRKIRSTSPSRTRSISLPGSGSDRGSGTGTGTDTGIGTEVLERGLVDRTVAFERTVDFGRTVEQVPTEIPPAEPLAAAPEAELPATKVEREPRIDFHEQVEPGVENELVVALDPKTAAAVNESIVVAIPTGQAAVDLIVQLFAPGFTVKPDDVRTLTVGRTFDAARERVAFQLTAKPVAQKTRREITADFSVGGVSVGGVSHVTWVVPPGETHEDREPSFKPSLQVTAAERSSADLKLIVSDRNGDGKTFAVRVTSSLPGFVVESLPMSQDLVADAAGTTSVIATTLGKTFQAMPRPPQVAPADLPAAMEEWKRKLLAKLVELGTQLWDWLPKDFQELYFKLRDRHVPPRSIHVLSDDMLFPWELVIPWRNIDGRRDMLAPLGTAHVIGRWRPGLFIKPEPQRYPVKKIAVVNPQYPREKELPASRQEASDLKTTFGAMCDLVQPCDLDAIRQHVLDATDVQLFHFTGHANFEKLNPNQSFLELENGDQLTAAGLGAAPFTAGAPIVVLNACSVGDSGKIASRVGGFAERCLQTGCSAVLAAYWPVSDGAAREFSVAFYDKLRRGRSFGEALQELRLERENDPTYQAYTFFGDPLAHLIF